MKERSSQDIYAGIIRQQTLDGTYRNFRREKQMDMLETRLTVGFEGRDGLSVLDICCGAGRLLYFLNKLDPKQHYTGIDLLPEVLDAARSNIGDPPGVKLEQGDVLKLADTCPKRFDMTVMYKTLLNFDGCGEVMRQLFGATKEKIYLTSLFYEGDVDFDIRIHKRSVFKSAGDYVHYNVYGIPSFRALCESLGASRVEFFDLKLDIDLPKSADHDLAAPYTVRTETGDRLEFTGVVLMPWKLVEITL